MARTDVLLTIAALTKSLGAVRARVGLFASVDSLMVFEGVCAVELLTTVFAGVAPLAAVDQPVLIEHRPCEEAFTAQETVIGTLAGVALPDVIVEVGSDREAALASLLGTLERLDALVEAQMLPQMTGLRVGLATDLA